MTPKLICYLAGVFLASTNVALAGVTIPNTPAGHTLQAWLNAFNGGDRTVLESYIRSIDPSQSLDGMLAFRNSTGGFDLLSIDSNEPLHILFRVKEKDSARTAQGDLLVKDGAPPIVESFGMRALPPGVSPVAVTLDDGLRARVIDGIAANLQAFYVDDKVAAEMIDTLYKREAAGGYSNVKDGYLFATRLTSDLRAVSHDQHLIVSFSPFKIPGPRPPTAQDMERMQRQLEHSNCGFKKLAILPDNIGYVKFNAFMTPAICTPTAEAAMAFVEHADAIIFDFRDNGGGEPSMVAFIASYLFDQPTHLNDLYERSRNSTTQFWTLPYIIGARRPTQPVYVLTSKRTFSGAEEFCYDLQTRKRATIVGEITGGGAHTVGGHLVADYFIVTVPNSKAINPITHTDWEGRGIQPDAPVAASDALDTAVRLASAQLRASATAVVPNGPPLVSERSTPSPGTEASLRRQISGWEMGNPDYPDMSPNMEEATLQQRDEIQAQINRLGPLRSLAFVKVEQNGWDVYSAAFAHGVLQFQIAPLSPEGKVTGEISRQLP